MLYKIKVVTSFLNQQPVNPFDEELGAAATTDYPTTEYPTDNPYQGRRRRRDAPVEGAAAAVEGAAAAAAGPRLEKREAREELAEPWTGARVEKREAPEVEEVEGEEVHARRKRASFQPNNRLRQALFQLKNVTKDNCWQLRPEDLRMPSDVIYGVEKFYAMQMYTAVRLANFLSDFLQTINPEEVGTV
ncbi:PREDICTED: uncharacterized protein LOC106816522 [Priapulus caudatus]|uniref:Uncharacterized protein LOC106816522 n=1 Tax=Priapulus caudatus TaxID=37621 RepID=A0ABM1EWR5_PRICU|nr:PREDICTED: uncharacterized protein LOC106816522 [Priapulus caudatus]